jgi:alanyl-tRNA synthetase
LLFANAGMVQFKDVFLGMEQRPYRRATTAQKCMRVSGKHNDLDEVGPSARHHTFFEMMGNFSFGDYFKAEAITFAWEFLTQELGLDPDRLWPTVYPDDDQAFTLWQEVARLPPERITRLHENFWSMGDIGPCGPDSEIMWDRGPAACTCGHADCSPAQEHCERWLELWNLVFMQFETRDDGSTVPLPNPSIDTGMGLERVTSVLQDVDNNYDTDVFMPIMRRTRELLDQDEAAMRANVVPYRVIADHSRAIAFLIADGVLPGNEGRSYVLRLILRRAARFGKLLGFQGPFLAETAQAVIETMGDHYRELRDRQEFIKQAITQEEERFLATLSTGLARLDQLADDLRAKGLSIIPGDEAFRLYDTYGFPLELTSDAARELGLTVDRAGFHAAMAEQRKRARAAQRFAADGQGEFYRQLDLAKTHFVGYDQTTTSTRILAIVRDGQTLPRLDAGESAEIVLAASPFYGESGGQVGDTGSLTSATGSAQVEMTTKPVPDLLVHQVRLLHGQLAVGDEVTAQVDVERRLDIARNHTATHLLHRALRQVLGEHAAQSGSLVAADRLRFDFSHLSPLTPDEVRSVEASVNAAIRANYAVSTRVSGYEQAVRDGAIALFGEKYGDQVRVVSVEGFSTELCGGTHLHATGQIGQFVITAESSIGSGLRRIEAVTGRGAYEHVRQQLDTLETAAQRLATKPEQLVERLDALLQEAREQRRQMQELEQRLAASSVESLLDQAAEVQGVKLLAASVLASDVETLRAMCDRLRDKLGSAVVALGALIDERPLLVVAVTKDLISGRGLHAGKLAGAAAKLMGGGGGGRPDMAQAGGKDATQLQRAVAAVGDLLRQQLS